MKFTTDEKLTIIHAVRKLQYEYEHDSKSSCNSMHLCDSILKRFEISINSEKD